MFTLVLVKATNNDADNAANIAKFSSLAPAIEVVNQSDSLLSTISRITTPMIITSTAITSSPSQLADVIRVMLHAKSTGPVWTALNMNDGLLKVGELEAEKITSALIKEAGWPAACIYAEPRMLQGLECEELRELLPQMILKAIASGDSMEELDHSLALNVDANSQDMRLSKEQTSRVLLRAVDTLNIEDMFPDYDWINHSAESAASAFHMLAAAFIKLEAPEAAIQCLTMSDSLEDSPRSQALRAIIAAGRGETLGAVAHLVSSLQEYEKRKKRDPKRCLVFTPTDTERLNIELQSGLDALNKHDNAGAFGHFAAAVFNFDSFYSQLGLDKYGRPVS